MILEGDMHRMRTLVVLLTVLMVSGGAAYAQQQQQSEQDLGSQLRQLNWQTGPAAGKIAGKASISIPANYVFLDAADTSKFLTLLKNLPRSDSYTFAPKDLSWFSVFDFESTGYVKDDEKIDPDALLQSLKEGNVRSNEERKKRGIPALYLESWFVSPHYDVQSKRLEWATRLRGESGDIGVNYNIRLLGRSGVMNATVVTDPAALDKDMRAFKDALAGFSFDQGERYSEFRSGDKVAEYGLAALVIGGAAAAAAKGGLFKTIAKFGWIIILAVGAFFGAIYKKFFGSRQSS
jgi:uncharacterized membrane-anchored protein